MKKILIVAAIAAAGVGSYIFQQQNSASSYNVLNYVPADTPIFSGQLEPFPFKAYLSSIAAFRNPNEQQLIDDLYAENNPKLNFFLNIFSTYQAGLKDPALLLKTFGFPEKLRAYFYTLGLLPVLKTEIENPQAFWNLLDKNELESGFTHRNGTLQSLNYRAYQLTDENDPAKIELIVAINKGLLTLTLNSAYHDQKLLAIALGLTKVENSLASSGKVEELIKTYHFKQGSVGFINHIELLKGFTTTDGNQLAKQITALEKYYPHKHPFTAISNSQCANDFASITSNWPRTVFGYKGLAVNDQESTLEIATIIESKNPTILNALRAIRGYIPKYTTDIKHNVVAMGIGLDVAQLAGSFTDIWHDLQTSNYTCQPLAALQSEISQLGSSIGILGMSAAMADGVKGISMAVQDYSITHANSSPALESLDALFTLSADNPEQIFNSIKMFSPELQQIQLRNNAEPIDLSAIYPLPAEIKLTPKLAIKGKHLVIYNGEKGEKAAQSLSSEQLSQNGIYNLSFDFKKMFTPIVTAIKLSGETIPEETRFLSNYNTRIKVSLDINPQGVVFNSYINNKAPDK
ncbi:MAG: hypothetical protein OQK77_02500 [Psychromonas sp.]|nr:hypothetical protein [Psychromonas sp.]